MALKDGKLEEIHQGYLHKRSKHLKLWNIRYFSLTKKGLSYSKKSGSEIKRFFPLLDLEVSDSQSNNVNHKGNYVFEIIYNYQVFFVSSARLEEKKNWIENIRNTQHLYLREEEESNGAVHGNSSSDESSTSMFSRRESSASSISENVGTLFTSLSRPMSKLGLSRKSRERRRERKRMRVPKLKKTFSEIWIEDVIPNWHKINYKKIEYLCFTGIPKHIRGRAWSVMLGNKLLVNEELFDICKKRGKRIILELEQQKKQKVQKSKIKGAEVEVNSVDHSVLAYMKNNEGAIANQRSETEHQPNETKVTAFQLEVINEEVVTADQLISDSEKSIKLLRIDMPRTFGYNPFFQEGAVGYNRVTDVLEAYNTYRPDLGYVQGMSYLAAILCFHMDTFSAFKAMVGLMSTELLFDMYRLEEERTFHYLNVYNEIFHIEVPKLYNHFEDIGLDPKMYMVDWALTLFTRSLSLEVALRIWDCYVLFGTTFFFQACMGILKLFENDLLTMDIGEGMKFLHVLPKSLKGEDIFEATKLLTLSRKKITKLLRGKKKRPWSPVDKRMVEVDFPNSYE